MTTNDDLEHLIALGHVPMPILKAVRKNCLECSGEVTMVRDCTVTRCPLFPYRMGKDPFKKKRVLSESHRKALQAGKKAHAEKSSLDEGTESLDFDSDDDD